MALKPLTDPERQAARTKALESRSRRAEIKTAFSNNELSVTEIFDLAEESEAIGRLRTSELLTCLKGVGDIRARALMDQLGISHNRRIQGLGPRQRAALIELCKRYNRKNKVTES